MACSPWWATTASRHREHWLPSAAKYRANPLLWRQRPQRRGAGVSGGMAGATVASPGREALARRGPALRLRRSRPHLGKSRPAAPSRGPRRGRPKWCWGGVCCRAPAPFGQASAPPGRAPAVALPSARAGDPEQICDLGPGQAVSLPLGDGRGEPGGHFGCEACEQVQHGGRVTGQRPRDLPRASTAPLRAAAVPSPRSGAM